MGDDQQNERLTRIETKIDTMTDSVNKLAVTTAVIHEKVNDLEVRRREAYERANKMSQRVDDLHDCVHDVEQHVGKVDAQMSIANKILVLCVGGIAVAFINQVFNIV